MAESLPFDQIEFWGSTGYLLIAAGSYFVLFQQITISRLTFESDNRSTGIRVTCSTQFILAWLILFVAFAYFGMSSATGYQVEILIIFSTLHCFVVGLFTSTETDFLSRRIRRNLPRAAALRFLVSPLLPGGGRGFLYILLHLAVIIVISQFNIWGLSTGFQSRIAALGMSMPCYCVIYFGFGAIAGRWGQKITPVFRPIHTRVLILLMAFLAMLVPYLLSSLGLVSPWYGYSLMEITNPFQTYDMLCQEQQRNQFGMAANSILQTAACVAIIVNLRSIWRGVTELKPYEPGGTNSKPQSAAADSQTTATVS